MHTAKYVVYCTLVWIVEVDCTMHSYEYERSMHTSLVSMHNEHSSPGLSSFYIENVHIPAYFCE